MNDTDLKAQQQELREFVSLCRTARQQFMRGEISQHAMESMFDIYIDMLAEYRKASGKRFRLPTRGYLIRAL